MERKFRIVCNWPSEVWEVQQRVELDDHRTDWMTAYTCEGRKWDGYNKAKKWLKEHDV